MSVILLEINMIRKLSEETKEKNRLRARKWDKENPERRKERQLRNYLKKKQHIANLEAKIKELEHGRSD